MIPFVSYYLLFMVVLITGMTAGRWRSVFGPQSLPRFTAWLLAGFVAPYTYFMVSGWGTQMGFSQWARTMKVVGWKAWAAKMDFVMPLWSVALLFYSLWWAVTVAWIFHESWGQSTNRARAKFQKRVSLPWLCAIAFGLIAWWGVNWSAVIIGGGYVFLASTLGAARSDHGLQPRYTQVTIYKQFGKYSEAEKEIVEQLEKAPDDFEGWFLLAEIYATQQEDLKSAHETVMQLVYQEEVTAPQKSQALRKLADWHLDIGENPKAARAALEELVRLLPGTIAAQHARRRLEEMPGDQAALRASREVKPIAVVNVPDPDIRSLDPRAPSGVGRVDGAPQPSEGSEVSKAQALETQGRAAMELAATDADLDEALERLTRLCQESGVTEAQWVRWMRFRADCLWQRRGDAVGAMQLLEAVEKRFPKTQFSMAAKNRRQRIEFERGQGDLFRPKVV